MESYHFNTHIHTTFKDNDNYKCKLLFFSKCVIKNVKSKLYIYIYTQDFFSFFLAARIIYNKQSWCPERNVKLP